MVNKRIEDRAGYLYLFQQEGTDFYKIGSTRNLTRRLRTIRQGMPHHEVVLIESYPVTDHIKRVETCVQKQLEGYRVAGEWFRFTNLDAWHKVVEQLPLIETLEIFRQTRVPNVGRPRKYLNEYIANLTPVELVQKLGISRQQAHQLLKRYKEEIAQEGE